VQAAVLQACDDSPEQAAPPLLGAGLVHERARVPPPHVTEHSDHADQDPLIAQAAVLQACCDSPVQAAPPLLGAGLEHERVWVPPLHVAGQLLHADQPPFTGTFI